MTSIFVFMNSWNSSLANVICIVLGGQFRMWTCLHIVIQGDILYYSADQLKCLSAEVFENQLYWLIKLVKSSELQMIFAVWYVKCKSKILEQLLEYINIVMAETVYNSSSMQYSIYNGLELIICIIVIFVFLKFLLLVEMRISCQFGCIDCFCFMSVINSLSYCLNWCSWRGMLNAGGLIQVKCASADSKWSIGFWVILIITDCYCQPNSQESKRFHSAFLKIIPFLRKIHALSMKSLQ